MKTIACLALSIFAASPTPAQSTFHGNVARTGAYATPGPARFGGVYVFDAKAYVFSSTVYAAGFVYVGDHDGSLNQEAFAPLLGDFEVSWGRVPVPVPK